MPQILGREAAEVLGTYNPQSNKAMIAAKDMIVETSESYRTEAVVSTNTAPEVAVMNTLETRQSAKASVSTKPPPTHSTNVLVSKTSAVVEKDIPHCMEYVPGIEKEGWIVGDITYKQTKDSTTIILKVYCESMF